MKLIPSGFPKGDYFLRELYSVWHIPYFGAECLRFLLNFCALGGCFTFTEFEDSNTSNDIYLILSYVILVADSKLPSE